MTTTFRITATALIVCMGLFLGCRKAEVDKDTQSSVDFSVAEAGYSGVLPAMNQIGIDEDGVNKASSCATITVVNWQDTIGVNNWPITILIDYGTAGCVDHDGKYKQGLITAVFHDRFLLSGSKIDVTLTGYKVNGIEYKGDITLKNNGNHNFSSTVVGGECIGSDYTIYYDGTSTMTWKTGFSTPFNATDDSFEYTNDSDCTNREGRYFEVRTTVPMLKTDECSYISKGIVEITPDELATRTVDFGDGTCDDEASVTVNGNTFVFTLN